MNYYSIASDLCKDMDIAITEGDPLEDRKGSATESSTSSGRMGSVLKWVLIVAGVLVLIFGGLVGFFVLKAKRAQKGQAE